MEAGGVKDKISCQAIDLECYSVISRASVLAKDSSLSVLFLCESLELSLGRDEFAWQLLYASC